MCSHFILFKQKHIPNFHTEQIREREKKLLATGKLNIENLIKRKFAEKPVMYKFTC